MYEYLATLTGVHDGDTISMDIDVGFSIHFLTPQTGNSPQSFRFHGMDAPELGRPDKLGEQARDAVSKWFTVHAGPYRVITYKDHTEKYGRYLLLTVLAMDNSELINDQRLAGYLKPYIGYGPKPIWP